MPEEWPIAAPAADGDEPARLAGRGRLSTVRRDFFLDPAKRLTEQERALMTAMLNRLDEDIASELQVLLPQEWLPANEDPEEMIQRLWSAGLLDDQGLVALLLLGDRAARALSRMREWAERHAWIVNEIVIAFFALLTVLDLIRSG